jgi:hypothetical protein
MDVEWPLIAATPETSDALGPENLESITTENESARAAAVGPDGLHRLTSDEERHVDITVVMVVTDRRIVFVAADALGDDPDADAGSIAYADLAGVDLEAGVLTLATTEDLSWRVTLPEATDGTAAEIGADLRWIGRVRNRLLATRNDVKLAAGTIRVHADGREWEAGTETYREARADLDDLVGMVQRTTPIPDEVLAPELNRLERTLECAYAELSIERADSRLTLGQQCLSNGDVERAADVLEEVVVDQRRARRHADAVQRGDAFRFGEQRELEERLERLEWEMQAVAAEPLRQAHEAKMLARSTSDADRTVEHWERALDRLRAVLSLEWGPEDRYLAEDPDAVREELADAAARLLAVHQTLARTEWDAGVDHHEDGEPKPAIRHLSTAIDHLERALELAEEFRPEAADELRRRLESMREGRDRVRYHASPFEPADEAESAAADDPSAEAEPAEEVPATISADELSAIDTHVEVNLGPDVTLDGDGDRGPELVLDGEDAH